MSHYRTPQMVVLLGALCQLLFAFGCNTFDPDLGDEPFRCGAEEPRCPDGYECDESTQVCFSGEPGGGAALVDGGLPAVVPDARPITPPPDAGGGPVDAGLPGLDGGMDLACDPLADPDPCAASGQVCCDLLGVGICLPECLVFP